ncbi:MAG: type ISP restriction/modification enzyme [Anaerolineae bacterium]
MLCKNLAILAIRQVVGSDHFSHIGVSSCVTDNRVFYSNRSAPAMYPLYLYPDDEAETLFDDTATSPWPPDSEHGDRVPNLSKVFVEVMEEKLGMEFVPHPHPGDAAGPHPLAVSQRETAVAPQRDAPPPPFPSHGEGEAFSPRHVLAYAYAVFHSPTYRQRYAEFLKIDFPRLPLTSDRDLFWRLVEKGEALMALHLMESPLLERTSVRFPKGDSNLVASRHPRYLAPGEPHPETGEPLAEGRVYINETQYFAGIDPQVWKFEIGGYQVLEKWLRDRKRADYPLSFDDVRHYQRIVVALEETMRLMEEIDALIDAHGGWPIM